MFNEMYRFESFGDDQARHLAEQRWRMRESAAIARSAHSRTGQLFRHLRRLADPFGPAGRPRSGRGRAD
jgi:hypothetical protein